MARSLKAFLAVTLVFTASHVALAEITGDYVESRTCDVYTGPCFANAQIGLAGKQAIMAWSIEQGEYEGVDLAGLKVVMAIRASDTLGFGGGVEAKPFPIRSVVLVDEKATSEQREALLHFAKAQAGEAGGTVQRVRSVPIELSIDQVEMVAKLKAGSEVELQTRKLRKGDCVCSNEEIYYPPLTAVENWEPAYTIDGGFSGRSLGGTWTNPRTRSAFLGTFAL